MTFTPEQTAALSAPLDRSRVAQRTQGGSQVSYIEGWHAIAEANRIFGFDAWNRETVDIHQLGEPREVNGKMRVDYMARVRIRVGDVVRDGCGFGQGIDKDVGQAHESALKEAETDAMKRAMMTFGNPFGLALYDKTQSNVATLPVAKIDDAACAELTTLLELKGVDTRAFCDHYQITNLRELPAASFENARTLLNKKPNKKAAA